MADRFNTRAEQILPMSREVLNLSSPIARIKQICIAPSLKTGLAGPMSLSDLERDPVEVLFSQFSELKRQGEAIDVEAFARQYPAQADDIRELFPTFEALQNAARPRTPPPLSAEWSTTRDSLQMGEYHLLREIGAGGMGIVYEALQESMQRHVAVKVLPREFSNEPIRRQRFLKEAQTVAKLSYRNIVPVIDFGESQGRCFFAMQLIEGVGLDWVISRLRKSADPLTPSQLRTQFMQQGVPFDSKAALSEEADDDSLACEFNTIQQQDAASAAAAEKWQLRCDSWKQFARIGIQAAKALQHAHRAGILHRDIKPGNLLLDEAGVIWITDFGLAKSESEIPLSGPNDVVGTLRYIAPERFEGKLDGRSDLYGLGLTLLELCTQQHAFPKSSRSSLIRQIIEGELPPPRSINPKIPASLEQILLKATAAQPDERYLTPAELIADLKTFAKGQQVDHQLLSEIEAQKQISVTPAAQPSGRWKWAAVVLVCLCLVQLGLFLNRPVRLTRDAADPGVRAVFEQNLKTELASLDAIYTQVTRRDLDADLINRETVTPLSQYHPQRAMLLNLQTLYRLSEQTAVEFEIDPASQAINARLALLDQLLE